MISILKCKTSNKRHLFYTVKSQKLVEPKVDESILKTTKYSKQSVNRTAQHIFHQDLHLTPPLYPYIHFITHPALISSPSPRLVDLHPTSVPFTSLQFISLHLSLSKLLFLEILDFLRTSNSLHLTSIHLSLS